MMNKRHVPSTVAIVIASVLVVSCGAESTEPRSEAGSEAEGLAPTELTTSAQEYLADLNAEASALDGLADELVLPDGWEEKARTEGTLLIALSVPTEAFAPIEEAFEERYPYVDLEYVYASTESNRTAQTLIAFRQDKFISDVIGSIGNSRPEFESIGAFADLSSLPVWDGLRDVAKSPDGLWAGYATKHWGFCYNTEAISKNDLPESWDEVVTSPIMEEQLSVSDKPNLFLYQLSTAKGLPWAQNFMRDLFDDVTPSRRQESMDAIPQLVANGTLPVHLPCANYSTEPLEEKGAPVSWYSPEPMPVTLSDLSLMANAKHLHASKIFLNWILSAEGQLVSAAGGGVAPVTEQLSDIPELYPYADQLLDAEWVAFPPEKETAIGDELDETWANYWSGSN